MRCFKLVSSSFVGMNGEFDDESEYDDENGESYDDNETYEMES